MNVVLENESLKVTVASLGAEIQSIVCDGLERMWQADPSVWGKHAPNLFPFIGRMKNNQYELNGQTYTGRKHGVVNDREFAVQQVSRTCARFVTESDEATRALYPFDWRLTIEISLDGSTVTKRHRVENLGDGPLLYELGGHEAYATCLYDGETMDDYYVQFRDLDVLEYFAIDEQGMLDVPKHRLVLEDGRLTVTPEQAGIDTFVVEQVPGSVASLRSSANDRSVTVSFEGFPYLGIWTMAGHAPRYLCIEPWTGLPDANFVSRDLSERPGIRQVNPHEADETAYTMTFV